MQDFFSSTGLNLNLMRHTIGSSDLTPPNANYTYDDLSGDINLYGFTLKPSGLAMVLFIQVMKAHNTAIKLVGASWSAPGWMKANKAQQGAGGNNFLNGTYTTTFVNYFVKYIQYFAAAGVQPDYLSVQNEPLNSDPNFPTMYVGAADMGNFVSLLGQSLVKNKLTKTKLMVYDHNTDQPSYPQTVINEAGSYAAAVGWHCYASNTQWSTISQFAAANPNQAQFMSECWTSPTTPWTNVPDFTLGPLQNSVSGVMTWTLASDTNYGPTQPNTCTSCRGLAVVNTSTGTYTKSLDYYLLGQFSKFIQPGAIALSTTGSYDFGAGGKLEAQGFLNPDGTKVIVIENTFTSDHLQVGISCQSGANYNGRVLGSAVTTWIIPAGQ